LHFGDDGFHGWTVESRARDYFVGQLVDRHVQPIGIGEQRAQFGLHMLDLIGRFSRRTGDRQCLVPVGVKILADRGVSVLPGPRGCSFPGVEHRQRTKLTGGLQSRLPACVARVEDLAHRLGAPPTDIGHRQRHRSVQPCGPVAGSTARNFPALSRSIAEKSISPNPTSITSQQESLTMP
jgi:hypothetical protein